MLTANDIQNIRFSKGVGGYKSAEVNEFIDSCAQTVSALTITKNDLEKKLEVLADKLIEYRNDEDNIRTALMSAQKLGDTVVREANHKAGLILDDARIKAEKIHEEAQRNIKNELKELERIKLEISNFKARMLSIYREHLSLIDVLPEVENKQEQDAETADSVEQANVQQEQMLSEDSSAKEDEETEQVDQAGENQTLVQAEKAETEDNEVAVNDLPSGDSDESKPKSRFGDLKFGDEYDITEDADQDNSGIFKRRK